MLHPCWINIVTTTNVTTCTQIMGEHCYPPCCASPGRLSAEQPHRPHHTCSSTGPSLPSPPSAGKQPFDKLWPPLQMPVLDGMQVSH